MPVHGPERDDAFAEWRAKGGVAVTTFDALATLPEGPACGTRPGMVVVDEAHFVKNPATRRSRAVTGWTRHTDRVLFLTGTPMENRVEEFRSLVRQLRPELVPSVTATHGVAGSHAFRRAVAPAYLRRNQDDVLAELPALVQADEWEEFSAADLAAYREAVDAGHFMRMRRAAYAHPETSAKLEPAARAGDGGRGERAQGRRVLVLPRGAPHGPRGPGRRGVRAGLGERAAARRQELVDAFGAADGHAVLLCQIQAGGVGLNIQAASVVILCEPQIKPTMEHQAVARTHRMGQIRTVQVHRLLAADSVDQRMLDILARKDRLFDAYARRSDVAEATPDAVDVSDGALARLVVEEEQRRMAAGADSVLVGPGRIVRRGGVVRRVVAGDRAVRFGDQQQPGHPHVGVALDVAVVHPGARAHVFTRDDLEAERVGGPADLRVDDPAGVVGAGEQPGPVVRPAVPVDVERVVVLAVCDHHDLDPVAHRGLEVGALVGGLVVDRHVVEDDRERLVGQDVSLAPDDEGP